MAQKPVVVGDKIGRNDMVTILNPSTGQKETLKYKHAQGKIAQGWTLVE